MQSRRILRASSSNEESSTALPVIQSVAAGISSHCTTRDGLATGGASLARGTTIGFDTCAGNSEIVESPANLWNLTAKMV